MCVCVCGCVCVCVRVCVYKFIKLHLYKCLHDCELMQLTENDDFKKFPEASHDALKTFANICISVTILKTSYTRLTIKFTTRVP